MVVHPGWWFVGPLHLLMAVIHRLLLVAPCGVKGRNDTGLHSVAGPLPGCIARTPMTWSVIWK
jgi:hypothetical protein